MSEPTQIATWMGRPITELSRDELLEALTTMGRLYQRACEDHAQSLHMLSTLVVQRGR